MTDQEINIAVAEACGWKAILRPCDEDYHYQTTDNLERAEGRVTGWRRVASLREPIPDYCNDLNAMYEAEKAAVNFNNILDYHRELLNVIIRDQEWPQSICIGVSARQRAEAFLKTLNLWTN